VPYPATWLRAERWEDEYELDIEDAVEVNGKVVNWWESATGIETRGEEIGMTPEQFASWPEFKAAVLRQLMRAAAEIMDLTGHNKWTLFPILAQANP
jgi:hypothetical protein